MVPHVPSLVRIGQPVWAPADQLCQQTNPTGCQQFAIIANCMDMLYLAKLANISPWYLCGETRQLVGNFSCHIYYMWQKSRTSRRVSPHIIYLAKVANQLWYLCGKTRQLVRNIYLPDILYVAKVANQLASFATYNTSGQSH